MKLGACFFAAGVVVTVLPHSGRGDVREPPRARRSFDLVMMDDRCTVFGISLGSEAAPKSADGSKFTSVCSQSGKRLTCRQQTRDETDSVRHQGIDFLVTDEQAPKMIMVSTDFLTLVIVDWARSEYVVASTWMNQKEGFIQKQCKGTIATREQLNDGPPMKRAPTRPGTDQ
jgi:hypothetical protein